MRTLLTLILLLALAAPASAAPTLAKLGDFKQPTYVTSPPGDPSHVFVTERAGVVRLVIDGNPAPGPFLDLSASTQSGYAEQGLLSIAFPPDYATSGRFYVYLTVTGAASVSGSDGELQVREYHRSAADPNVADPAGFRVLMAVPHAEAQNHDGGQLQFGPDGLLYAGTGDGGGGNDQFHHSQDMGSLLGKLLRFDVNSGAGPAIVSRGLRNPWRFSFDRQTGQLVIGDVGQDAIEEIDVGVAGNYGWPCFEGNRANISDPGCASGGTAGPFLTHTHSGDGFCSITGGYVVRDPGLPTLSGRYLYGDFCKGDLRSVSLADASSDAATGLTVANLSSFGEDACGRIFVASLDGPVFRLVDGALSPCGPAAPPPDTRPCRITVRITGVNSIRKRHFLTVSLRSDERCRASVTAKIKHVVQFRRVIKTLVAGRRTVLKLKLSQKGRRAYSRGLRGHKRLRVGVRLRAVDDAGNAVSYARSIRVRG
jgi:hypothetical protein